MRTRIPSFFPYPFLRPCCCLFVPNFYYSLWQTMSWILSFFRQLPIFTFNDLGSTTVLPLDRLKLLNFIQWPHLLITLQVLSCWPEEFPYELKRQYTIILCFFNRFLETSWFPWGVAHPDSLSNWSIGRELKNVMRWFVNPHLPGVTKVELHMLMANFMDLPK